MKIENNKMEYYIPELDEGNCWGCDFMGCEVDIDYPVCNLGWSTHGFDDDGTETDFRCRPMPGGKCPRAERA